MARPEASSWHETGSKALTRKLWKIACPWEGETSILAHFELWRPGCTSFIMSKYSTFMSVQGPARIERLRTRKSWDSETAGLQFMVANSTNRNMVNFEMSKTAGDELEWEEGVAARIDSINEYENEYFESWQETGPTS